jgi:VIT1/CCC1 family predicted Fe2+/Mn2+ transporter
MSSLVYEVLLDVAGITAVLIAYRRPSGADKRDVEQRRRLSNAARTADQKYADSHPWSKTAFLAIIIAFVVGGFFVTVYPGSSSSESAPQALVGLGFAIQAAAVVAMAVLQGIKGRTIGDAMKAVLENDHLR